MRRAEVYQGGILAGYLTESDDRNYRFDYLPGYRGWPISLAMPVRPEPYESSHFPPAFEGLLPEGIQLEALLRHEKLDANDLMGQLLTVGEDVVGSLVIRAVEEDQPDHSQPNALQETP